jgi:hypothetical protein
MVLFRNLAVMTRKKSTKYQSAHSFSLDIVTGKNKVHLRRGHKGPERE